uniref:Uncharacterized protein n=1 Tax=Timema shepardi TaxID=629360 RepID=A0A7R9AQI9_TIMSH|nr:unnamed protein product [Timema shepardi]
MISSVDVGILVKQAGSSPHCQQAALMMRVVTLDDEGEYVFVVRSPRGLAEGTITLNVTHASSFSVPAARAYHMSAALSTDVALKALTQTPYPWSVVRSPCSARDRCHSIRLLRPLSPYPCHSGPGKTNIKENSGPDKGWQLLQEFIVDGNGYLYELSLFMIPASVAYLANALVVLSSTAEDGEIEDRISGDEELLYIYSDTTHDKRAVLSRAEMIWPEITFRSCGQRSVEFNTTSALANYATEAAVEFNTTSALANYATEAGKRWFNIPTRYVFCLMASLGNICLFSLKVSLSVAINAMVKSGSSSDDTNNNQTETDVCPGRETSGTNSSTSETGDFDWDSVIQSQVLVGMTYGELAACLIGARLAEIFGPRIICGPGVGIAALLNFLCPVAARWSYVPLIAIRILQGIFGVGWGPAVPPPLPNPHKWFNTSRKCGYATFFLNLKLLVYLDVPG